MTHYIVLANELLYTAQHCLKRAIEYLDGCVMPEDITEEERIIQYNLKVLYDNLTPRGTLLDRTEYDNRNLPF